MIYKELKEQLMQKIEYLDKTYTEFSEFIYDPTEENWISFCDYVGNRKWTHDFDFTVDYGATKGVVIFDDIDWVVKMPLEYYDIDGTDFCKREVENYSYACMEGVEAFFAECIEIGKYKGLPLYAMRKAIRGDYYAEIASDRRNSWEYDGRESNLYSNSLYYSDLKELNINFDEKSDDEIQQLVNFCDEYEIFDFHDGNFGVVGDSIVIIDYSGY